MRLRRRPRFDTDAHLDSVVAFLADVFAWDDMTRGVARDAFGRWVGLSPADRTTCEFICDDAMSARFRLRVESTPGPLVFRMGYYPVLPNHDPDSPGEVRARYVTNQLGVLATRCWDTP